MERIILAAPRGFCAGVTYAVDIVNAALERFGQPLYVRHAIVHNEWVVKGFEAQGVIFIEDLADVPEGMPVVFSAHGVSPQVRQEAAERGLRVVDATCPLVEKVHREARDWASRDHTILYIGHAGHVEAVGTMGEAPDRTILVDSIETARMVTVPNPEQAVVLTQTTLSLDEVNTIMQVLRDRFPALATPKKEDICYATTNRQGAVKVLVEQCDLILVVGSETSSNSNRLREVAESFGVPAHLVNSANDLRPEWFEGVRAVGITSGASTPESAFDGVVDWLTDRYQVPVTTMNAEPELIKFRPPRELVSDAANS